MQKKLLTVAVAGALAAPVAALAQVTVYGSIDTGLKQQSKQITGGVPSDSKLSMDSQIKKSNRWGLKGSEDLGGGLMAGFNLEGAYASDTGATGLTFARRAVIELSKGTNSVTIGREYTLNFQTQGIWDPLSHDYGGSAGVQGDLTAGVRSSDAITAKFRFGTGGVGVQYAPGEVIGDGSALTFTAFNADFAFGPATIGVAASTKGAAALSNADVSTTNFGGAYKMGAFTFRLGIGMEEVDGGDETQKISGGVQYDFSPTLTGRLSYYDFAADNAAGTEIATAKTVVVNVEYSLSKRTLVYAVVDRKSLTGGAGFVPTGNTAILGGNTTASGTVWSNNADGATGIGVGIVHNF